MLLLILIIFFIFVLFSQIFVSNFQKKEGMTQSTSPNSETSPNSTFAQVYKEYDQRITDNTLILAQKNAGNIEYLKERIEDVMGLKNQIQDLSGNVASLQSQVNGLVSAQQQYVTQIAGGSSTPPTISGADSSSDIDTSNLVTS